MPRAEKPKKEYPKKWCTCWRRCKGGKDVSVQTWKKHTTKRESEVEEARKKGEPLDWIQPDPELARVQAAKSVRGNSGTAQIQPAQQVVASVASASSQNAAIPPNPQVVSTNANILAAIEIAPKPVHQPQAGVTVDTAIKPSSSTSPTVACNESQSHKTQVNSSTNAAQGLQTRIAAPAPVPVSISNRSSATAVSVRTRSSVNLFPECLREGLRSPFTLPPSPPPSLRYTGLENVRLNSFVEGFKRIREECAMLERDYRVLSEAYNELYRVIYTMYTLHRAPMPTMLGRAPQVNLLIEEPRLCDLATGYSNIRLRRTELQNLYGRYHAEYLRLVSIVAGLTISQGVWQSSSTASSSSSSSSGQRQALGTVGLRLFES